MAELWNVPVADVAPGDIIRSDADDITVTATTRLTPDEPAYPSGYRLRGFISRGSGRGTTMRSWSYHADHVFPTVVRA